MNTGVRVRFRLLLDQPKQPLRTKSSHSGLRAEYHSVPQPSGSPAKYRRYPSLQLAIAAHISSRITFPSFRIRDHIHYWHSGPRFIDLFLPAGK